MTPTLTMRTPEPLAMRLERARLRLHFARVDARLASAPVPAGACALARQRSLAQLRAYACEGRFPLHGGRGPRRPVFIDHTGTHCAMGHLLAINGHAPLARRIAGDHNYALLGALVGTPGLLDAVRALGLTAEEAAFIQPVYDGRGGVEVVETGSGLLVFILLYAVMALMFGSVLLGSALLLSSRLRQKLLHGNDTLAQVTIGILVTGGVLLLLTRAL